MSRSTTGHPIAGGMERAYEELVEMLLERGAVVALLTTRGGKSDTLPAYSEVWQLPGGRPGRYSMSWWIGTFLHKRSWHEWQPDVVLSVSSAAGAICLRPRIAAAMVAQCHGTAMAEVKSSLATRGLQELLKLPLNLLRVLREVYFYKQCDRVIAIGPAVKQQLAASPICLPDHKTTVIDNGVAEDVWAFDQHARVSARAQLGIPTESMVGIFAARLHGQKGADLAIRSLKEMPSRRRAYLLICGDGPERRSLEELARNLQLTKRVFFLGRLEADELAQYMSAADVFVFPTRRYEGLPLNILEALACGLPVVTVANANVPTELSEHAFITEGSPQSIAEAWASIPTSTARTSKLVSKFTKSGAATRYADLLLSVEPKVGEY